jgi:hypothetical protein
MRNYIDLMESLIKGEYVGEHGAPDKESGAPLYDLTLGGIYPDDVYGSNGARYYAADDIEAFYKCMEYKGRPNKTVTIYRSIPKDVKPGRINPGDWVTLTRSYAKEHGQANLNDNFKIVSKMVLASDIYTEGNSLEEWGYDPQYSATIAQEDAIRTRLGMETKTDARARIAAQKAADKAALDATPPEQ